MFMEIRIYEPKFRQLESGLQKRVSHVNDSLLLFRIFTITKLSFAKSKFQIRFIESIYPNLFFSSYFKKEIMIDS